MFDSALKFATSTSSESKPFAVVRIAKKVMDRLTGVVGVNLIAGASIREQCAADVRRDIWRRAAPVCIRVNEVNDGVASPTATMVFGPLQRKILVAAPHLGGICAIVANNGSAARIPSPGLDLRRGPSMPTAA
jgi:hypothetical protein